MRRTGSVAVADAVVGWLLDGDIAVMYQVHRDLLGRDRPDLRARIATEGEGAAILTARGADGHWGRGFYQPKWTSSHYTLLDLMNLGLAPDHPAAVETVTRILAREKGPDGGVNPAGSVTASDVCINGMVLSYACYFRVDPAGLDSVVDFLLAQRMPDGGFNCRSNRSGAAHSSLHTTTSVVEGCTSYLTAGHRHRRDEVTVARDAAIEFLLAHRLYRSHRTGQVIRPEFTRLHHPTRWYHDILRGLEALAAAGVTDARMDDALELLASRRRPDGRWAAARAYPGQTHIPPVRAGTPHPWVTLRALRVLRGRAEQAAAVTR